MGRRNSEGTVWFDYQANKSPLNPDMVRKEADFRGLLHTDGASGLGSIGPPGQVTALGCFAHLRRYFFKAFKAGESGAGGYLAQINRLFRLERLARHFKLPLEKRATLRTRHSLPLFETLAKRAAEQSLGVPPKSLLGEAIHYLLAQQAPLPGARARRAVDQRGRARHPSAQAGRQQLATHRPTSSAWPLCHLFVRRIGIPSRGARVGGKK